MLNSFSVVRVFPSRPVTPAALAPRRSLDLTAGASPLESLQGPPPSRLPRGHGRLGSSKTLPPKVRHSSDLLQLPSRRKLPRRWLRRCPKPPLDFPDRTGRPGA